MFCLSIKKTEQILAPERTFTWVAECICAQIQHRQDVVSAESDGEGRGSY